jgi:hypothetical protein
MSMLVGKLREDLESNQMDTSKAAPVADDIMSMFKENGGQFPIVDLAHWAELIKCIQMTIDAIQVTD